MPIPKSTVGEMPFLDHLEELRWRIIYSLLALVVAVGSDSGSRCSSICVGFSRGRSSRCSREHKLVFTHPSDGFTIILEHGDDVRLRARVAGHPLSGLGVPRARAQDAREARRPRGAVQRDSSCSSAGAALAYFVVVPLALPWLFGFGRHVDGAADHGGRVFQLHLRDGAHVRCQLRAADRRPRARRARHRHAAVPDEVPPPRDRAHRHRRRVPHARRHGLDDDRARRCRSTDSTS